MNIAFFNKNSCHIPCHIFRKNHSFIGINLINNGRIVPPKNTDKARYKRKSRFTAAFFNGADSGNSAPRTLSAKNVPLARFYGSRRLLSIPSFLLKNNTLPNGRILFLERIAGIEPVTPAWEAGVLPLNYIRICSIIMIPQKICFVKRIPYSPRISPASSSIFGMSASFIADLIVTTVSHRRIFFIFPTISFMHFAALGAHVPFSMMPIVRF